MKIAVIILHYGNIETTKNCLRDLSKKIGENRLILINNTQDEISSLTKIIPGTVLINNQKNLGFSAGVNVGIRLAMKDSAVTHMFLMNNDLSISSGSFNQLVLTFNKFPNAGIVSPILHHPLGYDWGGKFNKWTGIVKHKNWINKPKTTQSVEHVAGAAMMISREVVVKVGMLDERFFLYYEDLDYCLRARRGGYTIHINPDVIADHAVSSGTSALGRTKFQWRSHIQFINKHIFKLVYPTAYLYDLIFYPLVTLKLLLKGNK